MDMRACSEIQVTEARNILYTNKMHVTVIVAGFKRRLALFEFDILLGKQNLWKFGTLSIGVEEMI